MDPRVGTNSSGPTPDGDLLKQAVSLYQAAFESAADGLLVVDRDRRVIAFNRAFLTLWRVPESMAQIGDDDALLRHVLAQLEDPEGFDTRVRQIYADAEAVTFDVLDFKDGRSFERYSQPRRIEGIAEGRVWSFRDITEQRRSERMLRESERWLRRVIDQVPHFIFAKDGLGRYVLVNQALADAYGVRVEDLLDQTDDQFGVKPEEVAAYHASDRQVLATGMPVRIPEDRLTDATGALRWLETTKVPISLPRERGPGVLGVSTDITGRRILEAEFHQSQKMEAVGRLAGGIAHDFNNLLTAILGFSTTVLNEMAPGDARRRDLEDVVGAARRAADLTSQLLAFGRRQVLRPRVLDLNELIRGIERLLARMLGEDIQIVTHFDPALRAIRADRGQLEQVLLNLAVNAREAMPGGGRLTIETANEPGRGQGRDGPEIAWVRIRVSDTGIGMPADQATRIFEPFFTTKETGTGLGLAVVHGIVEQSGGRIGVESVVDVGTSFDVYLPATSAPVDAVPPLELVESAPVSATVLLVEDEEAVRRLTRRILEGDGYQVLEASNGVEGLAVAERWGDPIHLLLTDVVMPRMNGRDLAAALVARRPGTRVVFMSGYAAEAIGREGGLDASFPFLQKPFDNNDLRRAVREALGAPAVP